MGGKLKIYEYGVHDQNIRDHGRPVHHGQNFQPMAYHMYSAIGLDFPSVKSDHKYL